MSDDYNFVYEKMDMFNLLMQHLTIRYEIGYKLVTLFRRTTFDMSKIPTA